MKEEKDKLYKIRHSFSHLLAAAVLEFDPEAKPTIGPPTDSGFYYDFEFSKPITEDDLSKLQKSMKKIFNKWEGFEMMEKSPEEAREFFKDNPYKTELIEGIIERGEKITFYKSGDFVDLCEGGHVDDINDMKMDAFKVSHLAGAYWRGDEKNTMLTRIYGYAFESKEDLDAHLNMLEEAKKRDHRKLGAELDLFHFDESIGSGLTVWLPKGNIIKEELEKWAKETEEKWGYQRVTTPIITKEDLFYTSGHLPLYKESMYAPIQIENENYYIKPMNCPFHHKAFAARPHSYKELPIRFAEYGWCHRYEDSGSLFGLMRVRGMQMNDAHIYVQREKAIEEFVDVIKLHEYYYKILRIEKYEMELALRDPNNMEKYHGDEQDWKDAEQMTIDAMEKSGVPYTIAHEGAAFYGPKMDFQIYSAIGRQFTASTNQLDLYMGKKFELEYTDKDGSKKTPVIIHRAPLGTHERFIGFLIEHFAGAFPTWLSPLQVKILPISSDKHMNYAEKVKAALVEKGVRVEIDADDSLGKRVRNNIKEKNPYALVVGDEEVSNETVTVESRDNGKVGSVDLKKFVEDITREIKERK